MLVLITPNGSAPEVARFGTAAIRSSFLNVKCVDLIRRAHIIIYVILLNLHHFQSLLSMFSSIIIYYYLLYYLLLILPEILLRL